MRRGHIRRVQQQPEQAQERHDDHTRHHVDDVGLDHDQYDVNDYFNDHHVNDDDVNDPANHHNDATAPRRRGRWEWRRIR